MINLDNSEEELKVPEILHNYDMKTGRQIGDNMILIENLHTNKIVQVPRIWPPLTENSRIDNSGMENSRIENLVVENDSEIRT